MSRAFVRESDKDTETEPERRISAHPNLVTAAGLRQISSQVAELERARRAAREAADKALLERISRDLRYWMQRATTARLIEPQAAPDAVRFGTRVTVRLEDGTEPTLQLVGEDEANPALGLLSWVAPLAAALIGKGIGDLVDFQGRSVAIVRIESAL
jgi:transcription elongation GreA/GreB family factor